MDPSAAGSSTSPSKPSPPSPPSARGSLASSSPGEPGAGAGAGGVRIPVPVLGRRALRDLASRHGLSPTKALGQHFLADPNLARAIVGAASVGPGDRVLEVGPGLGSLTVALAAAGASVLAVELDRAMVPALEEVTAGLDVRVVRQDALTADWGELLEGPGWKMVSNLPYNVAVPLLLGMLERRLPIQRYVVMVQREVGERLVAGPGSDGYGAPSVRVAYHAEARPLRKVPPSVFWPEPKVESLLIELRPRTEPPVATDPAALFRVVEEGFAQRRKTMRNALVRLGLDGARAESVLAASGVDARARAEDLGLAAFARIAEEAAAAGWAGPSADGEGRGG